MTEKQTGARPEVIVVGAGPAGLMLGCELGLAGVRTVLLERDTGPRREAPGVGLNISGAEVLDLRGLLDPLREGAVPLPTVHFSMIWLEISHLAGRHENGYLLPQGRIEAALRERAAGLGVEIRYGAEVTGVEQDAEGVTVRVRTDGVEHRTSARFLVGADGWRSAIRAAAGIGFSGTDETFAGLVGDIRVDFDTLPAQLLGPCRHPDGGVYIGAPVDPGKLRIMTAEFGRESVALDVPVSTEELRATVRRVTGAEPPEAEAVWLRRHALSLRVADRFRAGRILLAGDAAHVFPPFGGERLNTCLEDALNLGWKLAAVLRGAAGDDLLDTYEEERRAAAVEAVDSARAQVVLGSTDANSLALRALFERLARTGEANRVLADLAAGLAPRYPLPEDPDDPDNLVGRRLAPGELKTLGDGAVADALRRGRGALLHPEAGLRPELGAGRRLDVVSVAEAAEAMLVRPDGRVAATGLERVLAALPRWFGEAGPEGEEA